MVNSSSFKKSQRKIFAFLQLAACLGVMLACKPRNSRLNEDDSNTSCSTSIPEDEKVVCIGYYASFAKNMGIFFNKHEFFDHATNFVIDSAKRFDDMSFTVKISALMFLIDQFWQMDNAVLPYLLTSVGDKKDTKDDKVIKLDELLNGFYMSKEGAPANNCHLPDYMRKFKVCYSASSCDIAMTSLMRVAFHSYELTGVDLYDKYHKMLTDLREDIQCLAPTTLRSYLTYRADSLVAQAEYFSVVKDWSNPFHRAKLAARSDADSRLRLAVQKVEALMTQAETDFLRKSDPTLLRPLAADSIKQEFFVRPSLMRGAIGDPDADDDQIDSEVKENIGAKKEETGKGWFALTFNQIQQDHRMALARQFSQRVLETHRINTMMYVYERRIRDPEPLGWFNYVLQESKVWDDWFSLYRVDKQTPYKQGHHPISAKLAYFVAMMEDIALREARLPYRVEYAAFLVDLTNRVSDENIETNTFRTFATQKNRAIKAAADEVDRTYSSYNFSNGNKNVANLVTRERMMLRRFPDFESLHVLVMKYSDKLNKYQSANNAMLEHFKNADNTPDNEKDAFKKRLTFLEANASNAELDARLGALQIACVDYIAGNSGTTTYDTGEKEGAIDCEDWIYKRDLLDFGLFKIDSRNSWAKRIVNDMEPFKDSFEKTPGLKGRRIPLSNICVAPGKSRYTTSMTDIQNNLLKVHRNEELTNICTQSTVAFRENVKYTVSTNLIFMTPVMVAAGNIVGNLIRQSLMVAVRAVIPEGFSLTASNMAAFMLRNRIVQFGSSVIMTSADAVANSAAGRWVGNSWVGRGAGWVGANASLKALIAVPFDSAITGIGLQVVNRAISAVSTQSSAPFADPDKSWTQILVDDWARVVVQDTIVFSALHLVNWASKGAMAAATSRIRSPGLQESVGFGIDFTAKSVFFSTDFLLRQYVDEVFKHHDPQEHSEDLMTRFSHSLVMTANFELFDKLFKGHFSYENVLAQVKQDEINKKMLELWQMGRKPGKFIPKFAVERAVKGGEDFTIETPDAANPPPAPAVVADDEAYAVTMNGFMLLGLPNFRSLIELGTFQRQLDRNYREFKRVNEDFIRKLKGQSSDQKAADMILATERVLSIGESYYQTFSDQKRLSNYIERLTTYEQALVSAEYGGG